MAALIGVSGLAICTHAQEPIPKFTEDFAPTVFPPAGWVHSGSVTTLWSRHSSSAYGIGSGSARAYFWGVSRGTGVLETVVFDVATSSDALLFEHAYATYYEEVDRLNIYGSTNGGANYFLLLSMPGGPTGILNTAGVVYDSFVPTASQWRTCVIPLIEGINRLRFDAVTAYGNNLYLDNVRILDYSSAADLSLTLSDAPDPVAVGGLLTYTLLVSNAGPATAENTMLTNRCPSQALVVSADSSHGTWTTNAQTLVFNLGALSAGESATLSVVVQPQAVGMLTNTAEVSTTTFEPMRADNRRTVTTWADWEGGDLFFSQAAYAVDENRGTVTLTVLRTNGVVGAVSFSYQTMDGTAEAGNDYVAGSGTLNLSNGQTFVSWTVPILNDAEPEGHEFFTVRLSNPTGGARLVAPSNAVVTIRDDDGVAAMPFEEGFEGSVLSNYWATYTTGLLGPQITVSNGPHSGMQHVNLNGDFASFSLNELILCADLSGREGVYLRFWHKRLTYDWEYAMSDVFVGHMYANGVAISVDGTTWFKAHRSEWGYPIKYKIGAPTGSQVDKDREAVGSLLNEQ